MKLTSLFVSLSVLIGSGSLGLAQPQTEECLPELPHLETGHVTLTDKNFVKWKKDNEKLHILAISDSSCTNCCATESVLDELKQKFDSKVYVGRKGKKIQIARADTSEQWNFFAKEGIPIEEVPAIFVMHEGRYYRYTVGEDRTYDDSNGLVHFMNRLQHPLLPLDSEQAIEQFLDTSIDVEETTGFLKKETPSLGDSYSVLKHKTRVLVFMFDKDEYQTEMKLIRDAGRILSQRLSVRLGLVTDPKLIRHYKAHRGNMWFNDEVQLSSIVLQRFDKQTFSMDLFHLDNVGALIHFINKKSLLPVTELDNESAKLVEMVGQQVLVGVTSLYSKDQKVREDSRQLVQKTLEQISPALYRGMTVATVEFSNTKNMMKSLGFTEADMPIIYVSDSVRNVPRLYKGELEQNAIRAWAIDIIKNSQPVHSSPDVQDMQSEVHSPRPVLDDSLEKTLKKAGVSVLDRKQSLDDLLAFEGDDICIFFYSTSIDDEINRFVIERYSDLTKEVKRNTKRMRFIGYDLNKLGPHRLLEASHPNIWLSPGNQRSKGPRLFRGQAEMTQMADFLVKHADNKFKMNTANLDQKVQISKYAEQQGVGLDGGEKPKNIMDEVEQELMRRGEL